MSNSATQAAREELVMLRRQRLDLDRKIAATETFIAAMTGKAPASARQSVGLPAHSVDPTHARHGDVEKVLEALAGTETDTEGMARTDIATLTSLNGSHLANAIAWLIGQERIVQANAPVKRNQRFKLRTEADRVVVKLHAGTGEVGR